MNDLKAIILASGQGTRLRPLTDHVPKAMVKVGGMTIMERQLRSLAECGVSDLVVTTGPFRELLEEHVRGIWKGRVEFVHNPLYQTTNYIYSLWLAAPLVTNCDVLLLHGDLIFDTSILRDLLASEGSRIPINKEIPPPDKDFKALVEDGKVIKIGVDVNGPSAFFCAPMYCLRKVDWMLWLEEIEFFIRMGKESSYAEDAFNELAQLPDVRALFFETLCIEIDSTQDAASATILLSERHSRH